MLKIRKLKSKLTTVFQFILTGDFEQFAYKTLFLRIPIYIHIIKYSWLTNFIATCQHYETKLNLYENNFTKIYNLMFYKRIIAM